MQIEFKKAANGEETCIAKNFHIHSSYNPSREAQKFVQQITVSFNPKFILVAEPALSYCAKFLKERFPKSVLCCIRYSTFFDKTNFLWEKVFYASSGEDTNSLNTNLGEELFSFLGDEGISNCLFISWIPSQAPFQEQCEFTQTKIKEVLQKAKNVLLTRNYFAKRWIKNSIRICQNAKNNFTVKHGNFPIVICASGPSLSSSIKFLKEKRNRFFLIAVSSSLRPLVENKIIPDLCISTDGGFWAKKHISFSLAKNKIPLALASEGSCFASVLEKSSFIPLSYEDGPSAEILKTCDFKPMKIQRNGTVSGTAAVFALGITDGPVFFCGLDLSETSGYQHIQPNELELENKMNDNRFHSLETRIFSSSLPSSAMKIYCDWFSSNDFKNRLFRLSDNFAYKNSLGKIPNVNWNDFELLTKEYKNFQCDIKIQKLALEKKDAEKSIKNLISKNFFNPLWQKEFVPSQFIKLERNRALETEGEAEQEVFMEMKKFTESLNTCFTGGTKL